jgi:hypothetical protein
MIEFIAGAVVGLVVGWNFLPQPQWVVDLLNKVKGKLGGQ